MQPNGMYGAPYQGPPQGYPMQPGMPMGGYPPQGYMMNQGPYGQQQQMQQMPQQQMQQQLDPPTDEEQMWLEQQMEQAQGPGGSAASRAAPDPVAAAEAAALEQASSAPTNSSVTITPAGDGQDGYEDVMKMIEENRRKNEAKRAAQSARNAEIVAAFEARNAGGEQQ